MGAFNIMPREQQEKKIKMKFCILFSLSILKAIELNRQQYLFSGYRACIYLLSIEEAQPRALIDSIRTELQPRLGSRPLMALCNEYGTIYAISSDFGDRMTTQSMGLI